MGQIFDFPPPFNIMYACSKPLYFLPANYPASLSTYNCCFMQSVLNDFYQKMIERFSPRNGHDSDSLIPNQLNCIQTTDGKFGCMQLAFVLHK